MTYQTRTLSVIVLPKGEPIYSGMATTIKIDDEAAGEFVIVSQDAGSSPGHISIAPVEWPQIREAIDRMIGECRDPVLIDGEHK